MTNLLAMILSLAMMLTGATTPVAEPVSRTLLLGNITVTHNDEEVVLSPYVSAGVTTDGAKALFDFYVGSGSDTYLPFQASVDEDGVLVLSDNSNVTLKLSRDEIDEMFQDGGIDAQSQAIISEMFEFGTAYADLLKLLNDPDAMNEIQVKAQAVYDELVDRGEGVPGTVLLNDEVYEVTNYEYDIDSAQMGALTDAVMASDERLSNYSNAYFKLLSVLPEDSGLSGIDSYAAILEKTGVGMDFHITESVGADGLDIQDGILRFSLGDQLPQPMEFVVHGVKMNGEQTTTMTGAVEADGMLVNVFMEGEMAGRDMSMNLVMTLNPADAAQAAYAETDGAAEAEDVDIEIENTDDDDPEDGESDGEDAYFFTVDFDRGYDEAAGRTSTSLDYALDIAEQDIHGEFSIEGASDDNGFGDYAISGGLDIGEESYGFSLDATLTDSPIDARIDADKAVSVSEFDPSVLIAGVSADALKLYTDESVQKLIAMAQSLSATQAEIEEPEDDDDDEEPAEMTFRDPQFNWLPEGYAVENIAVDEEYQDVGCTISNPETGESIFVDITQSYSESETRHYILNDDGSYELIEGRLLNEDTYEDSSVYSLDNGSVNISVFPSSIDVSTEDVIRMLSSLTF